MKIIVFIITALIQAAGATFGFFVLLLGLNGYNETDATPSLVFYIALASLNALGLGAASAYTAKRLAENPSLGKFGALAIAIISFAILGIFILFAGWVAALFLAETIRTWK
ncbi:MAG: hypothetical protein H0W58_01115 [Acidobacteria bacterium]|jgi:hypothetical protein|nr:hypothetical protein [Acidobacteriota bacterium]